MTPDSLTTRRHFLHRGLTLGGAGATVPMFITVEEDDLEMDTVFFWIISKGKWTLWDVSFDGSALTKDYQNQFGRIIKKDGVKGLLGKLVKKLEKVRKTAVL